MEDRGRNSRTYNNRKKTSARPSGRPASQSRQPSAKKTENSGGAGAYAAEKKKTTHDTICPVDYINHCSNCRNHFVETLQPIKRTI